MSDFGVKQCFDQCGRRIEKLSRPERERVLEALTALYRGTGPEKQSDAVSDKQLPIPGDPFGEEK